MRVLVPSGRLLEECQYLGYAKRAMDTLTYHNVSRVEFLEDELLKHHVLFAKLYADCVKFRPHWQLHVPAAVRRSGKILHPEVTPVAGLPWVLGM